MGFDEEALTAGEEGGAGGNRWPRQETLALLKIRWPRLVVGDEGNRPGDERSRDGDEQTRAIRDVARVENLWARAGQEHKPDDRTPQTSPKFGASVRIKRAKCLFG